MKSDYLFDSSDVRVISKTSLDFYRKYYLHVAWKFLFSYKECYLFMAGNRSCGLAIISTIPTLITRFSFTESYLNNKLKHLELQESYLRSHYLTSSELLEALTTSNQLLNQYFNYES